VNRSIFMLIMLVMILVTGAYAQEEQVSHCPISIFGDEAFTQENGVVTGAGSENDPYVISGWNIDATGEYYGIHIKNTTKAFIIVDCLILGAECDGIYLEAAAQAHVENCELRGNTYGLSMKEVKGAIIEDNAFLDSAEIAILMYGASGNEVCGNWVPDTQIGLLLMEKSTNNAIQDNVFDDCGLGIKIYYGCGGNHIYRNDFLLCRASSDGYNLWDNGKGVGNYWSDYRVEDADGDGIGDRSYGIFGQAYERDRYPSMIPFHSE
jgi:parallel beta-helix repeat protein